MRIRLDHVTNSSSSSFICTFAKIENEKLAETIIKQFNLEVMTGKEAKLKNSGWFGDFGADWAGVYINTDSLIDDEKYVYWERYGEHDEGDFWNEEDSYYDYDIDFEDFSERSQETVGAVNKKNGFSEIQLGYGAGRDG